MAQKTFEKNDKKIEANTLKPISFLVKVKRIRFAIFGSVAKNSLVVTSIMNGRCTKEQEKIQRKPNQMITTTTKKKPPNGNRNEIEQKNKKATQNKQKQQQPEDKIHE